MAFFVLVYCSGVVTSLSYELSISSDNTSGYFHQSGLEPVHTAYAFFLFLRVPFRLFVCMFRFQKDITDFSESA
jgi:hypothetical protein